MVIFTSECLWQHPSIVHKMGTIRSYSLFSWLTGSYRFVLGKQGRWSEVAGHRFDTHVIVWHDLDVSIYISKFQSSSSMHIWSSGFKKWCWRMQDIWKSSILEDIPSSPLNKLCMLPSWHILISCCGVSHQRQLQPLKNVSQIVPNVSWWTMPTLLWLRFS